MNIDDKNISLFLGSKTHLVFYPINQKKELNLVCIVRNKVYDPENIKNLIKKFVTIQNPNLEEFFNDKIKSYPLYSSSKIHPSSNKKVFYIGDAFNGFLPSLAQGAGQSIESAYELYHLIKENNPEITSIYFKNRSRRVKIIKRRSDLNFFIFHFSNSIIKKIRNFLMKFLLKRKFFINRYIGTIYKD